MNVHEVMYVHEVMNVHGVMNVHEVMNVHGVMNVHEVTYVCACKRYHSKISCCGVHLTTRPVPSQVIQ